MMYSVIVSILLVVAYIATATWRKKQLPESISALVYELPRRWQWVWIVWMWVVAFTTCIPLIDAMPEGVDVLGFATLACLVFCGAMPIKRHEKNRAHYWFVRAAGVLSQASVAFVCYWWLIVWLAIVWLVCDAYIAEDKDERRWYDKKGVLIAEVLCTAAVFGSVITKSLIG